MTALTFEHIIIGFGKAGKTLAGTLAQEGKRVALIEKDPNMYGGTCINVGCIPSKTLKDKAQKGVLFGEAMQQKNALIQSLNQANFDALSDKGVQIFTGEARFEDAHHIAVQTTDGSLLLKGDFIYINTGARPRHLSIKGADLDLVKDSTSIMQLDALPQRLVILGAGYIGLEFANMFCDFGSKVTVLETQDTFLARENQEDADAIKRTLQDKGISIHLGQKVQAIEETGVVTQYGYFLADIVLIAAGRIPNTQALNLDKAGVLVDEQGFIQTDAHLKTHASHIFAMGDVAGGAQFTYASLDDFRIIKDQILNLKKRNIKERLLPMCVFIDPPFARTGMDQKTAEDAGYRAKSVHLLAKDIPKAKVLGQTQGHLRATVCLDTGKILGATFFCAKADELINLIHLAICESVHYQTLADQIFTHPTMGESLNNLFEQI